MKLLSLFSGIGGIDLAARWAGIETVAFCEIEPFCQKVLAKHWPGVPIFDDVRTLTAESLRAAGVERVDMVAGGFPCQPFSTVGKQKGAADDRHLWPEMLRIVDETKPRWVVGENVTGLVNMALDGVLADLEGEGYEARAVVIPACAVGAPHIRERVWIVAHAEGDAGELQQGQRKDLRDESAINGSPRCAGTMADAACAGAAAAQQPGQLRGLEQGRPVAHPDGEQVGRLAESRRQRSQWAVEPPVGRVAHGIPRRVDRLRGLGNAVVPQVVYPIFEAIMQIERAA